MGKEVFKVKHDDYWYVGNFSNEPFAPKPLQIPSSSSIEFLHITVSFFRVVTRSRSAAFETEPIELYSGRVTVEQFNDLQKVTDFFSPMLIQIGVGVEESEDIISGFLSYIQSKACDEGLADCKELPVKFLIKSTCKSTGKDDINAHIRFVARLIGLPSVVLGNGLGDQECAICVSELRRGCRVTHLPCAHVYHTHCLLVWLLDEHSQRTCPLCRREIVSAVSNKAVNKSSLDELECVWV